MVDALTVQDFVENWRGTELSERASYQAHFMDLCRFVDYETPSGSGKDSHDNIFSFEYSLKKLEGTQGFADVYLQGHFAIEYKAPNKYKDLRAAYDQLLQYREQLQNPPLLIVTDIQNWEIHTNWSNTEKRVYRFTHEDILNRSVVQDYLRHIFTDPAKLHPHRNTEQVTADAAKGFQTIADNMREWQADPERIARFLTKLVFCLFAEDVSLLPSGPKGETGIFSEIIENNRHDSKQFVETTEYLFKAMADGGKIPFVNIQIPYFNGSLFEDVRVEELKLEALTALENASKLNWESVEPAIFGTLFERSLDPDKRAQLGAHYTSREDILLIVNPVLMRPLERQWEQILSDAQVIRPKYDSALAESNRRNQTTYSKQLENLRESMLASLRDISVLDPACGSGNFLYVALQRLMDMEKEVIKHPVFAGLPEPFPEVHPRQMYGIEINPIAHALASIVVWIGYLQWRRTNGYLTRPKEPILEDIHENIVNMDAILAYDAEGKPIEPEWQAVDVIIGNPPFLGDKKMRGELGDKYVDELRKLYDGRVSGQADFVTYWFEKSRAQIDQQKVKRAGLLSTQGIRGGANRLVLDKIKQSGDIFMAWQDREWTLEGAAVRVSIVGFDDGSESEKTLDSLSVSNVTADLTASIDVLQSINMHENKDIAFIGDSQHGPFEIPDDLVKIMLKDDSKNKDVLRVIVNALEIVRHPKNRVVVDFPPETSLEGAEKYKLPMKYIRENVKPLRDKNRRKQYREYWWIHGEARPAMREAIYKLPRFIVTPRVSKYRVFVWMTPDKLPSDATVAIARDDDYFLGVLHSKLHEVWALRMGTALGPTPRYTPTTTFGTFPFPYVPRQEDESAEAYQAISRAAKQLHEERDAWLNPAPSPQTPLPQGARGFNAGSLKDRTLTNLYNALAVFRGEDSMKIKAVAGDFAPRLAELHDALDKAVCAAYGWDESILEDEEEILRHLLALNLERAEA